MHGISRTTGVLAPLELRLWAADGPELPNHALCGVALGKAGMLMLMCIAEQPNSKRSYKRNYLYVNVCLLLAAS